MTQYFVDLCSFSVEADSKDEARTEAIRLIDSGEERAIIDQIVEA